MAGESVWARSSAWLERSTDKPFRNRKVMCSNHIGPIAYIHFSQSGNNEELDHKPSDGKPGRIVSALGGGMVPIVTGDGKVSMFGQ